ncbi:MAG: hypothetical protein H6R12_1994 [Proteobacteria bacterium]|nr:hypothetical protein [Pseudomonadota bacterium]
MARTFILRGGWHSMTVGAVILRRPGRSTGAGYRHCAPDAGKAPGRRTGVLLGGVQTREKARG